MPSQVQGINLQTIKEKYPNFYSEYTKVWRPIVKKRLQAHAASRSNCSKLTGIKVECLQQFPYLSENEISVVQDRISGMFRNNLGDPDWDPWREQLPTIFGGSKSDQKTMLTIFETSSETNEPISVSTVPKLQTFTMVVSSSDGEQVFKWTGVPKDIAMTSISEITKALA